MVRKIILLLATTYSLLNIWEVASTPNRDFFLKSAKNVPRIGRSRSSSNDKPPSERGPFFAKPKQIPRIGRTTMDEFIDENLWLNWLEENYPTTDKIKRFAEIDKTPLPSFDAWNNYPDVVLTQTMILDLLQKLENENDLKTAQINNLDNSLSAEWQDTSRDKRGSA